MEALFPEDLWLPSEFNFEEGYLQPSQPNSLYTSFDDILSAQPYEDSSNLGSFLSFENNKKILIQPTHRKTPRKTAHHVIERRYRNNINDRMTELKNTLPALNQACNEDPPQGNTPAATKLNKATILKTATDYIQHLKRISHDLKQDNQMLHNTIGQFANGPAYLQTHLQQNHEAIYPTGSITQPRVFMAMFMALSLFSASPLTTSPTEDNHHPTSRAFADNTTHYTTSASAPLSDFTWNAFRTCGLLFCLFHLCWPWIQPYAPKVRLKKKRVQPEQIPGERRCHEMYTVLSCVLPQTTCGMLCLIVKEALSLLLISNGCQLTQRKKDMDRWIKLQELLCVDPTDRVLARIYVTLKVFCLVHSTSHRPRAYATAALQFPGLARFFWPCVKKNGEPWMMALAWADPEQHTYGGLQTIPQTRAWSETLEALQGKLSYTVLVPVQILSSLHLFKVLSYQLEQVLIHPMDPDTCLVTLMYLTQQESLALPHWLATVGAVAEALLQNNDVDAWLPLLSQRVPRSITGDKLAWDEDIKRRMIHTLIGAAHVQKPEQQKQGLRILQNLPSRRTERPNWLGLESQVISLAEWLVDLVGLEALTKMAQLEPTVPGLIKERASLLRSSLRRSTRHLSAMDQRLKEIKRLIPEPVKNPSL
ncbi:hypothetical protein BY458DRAFT_514894 [Sporodiniella umbellata]|nr:hypothetical protein BY458DRAFT_514894 [Sporodiniella umbellata]